jgi:hypothetical protein
MSKAAAIAFLSIGELLAFCPHGVHQLSRYRWGHGAFTAGALVLNGGQTAAGIATAYKRDRVGLFL